MQDLISPTRDHTHVPCSGSMESQPLNLEISSYQKSQGEINHEEENSPLYQTKVVGFLRFKENGGGGPFPGEGDVNTHI